MVYYEQIGVTARAADLLYRVTAVWVRKFQS